jgi:hypothetical protein
MLIRGASSSDVGVTRNMFVRCDGDNQDAHHVVDQMSDAQYDDAEVPMSSCLSS